MKNIFNHNQTPAPYDPVEMTIYTPELGTFAISGAFQDIEPSYEQILQEQAAGERRMRHAGKFALTF